MFDVYIYKILIFVFELTIFLEAAKLCCEVKDFLFSVITLIHTLFFQWFLLTYKMVYKRPFHEFPYTFFYLPVKKLAFSQDLQVQVHACITCGDCFLVFGVSYGFVKGRLVCDDLL